MMLRFKADMTDNLKNKKKKISQKKRVKTILLWKYVQQLDLRRRTTKTQWFG